MISEFLMFGGFLFWAFFGVMALIITTQVANDRTGWAMLTLLGFLVVLTLFSNVPLLQTVRQHPIYILYGLAAYVGVGAAWGAFKWNLWTSKLFRTYNDLRVEFLQTRKLEEMPTSGRVLDEFNNTYEVKALDVQTKRMVRNNKSRITSWMTLWPFSLAAAVFGDLLINIFHHVYDAIGATLQRVSDRKASRFGELG